MVAGMKSFYVTFGQSHPLRDHWIEIQGANYEVARELAFETFGPKFAFFYRKEDFNPDYFEGGRAGRVIWTDKV